MEKKERRTMFYNRVETNSEIKITWKPIAAFIPFLGMILYFVFSYLSNTTPNIDNEFTFAFIGFLSIIFTFVYFFIYLIRTSRISREIKTATKAGGVEVSGSKWSISNPMTVTIRKDR